MQPSENDIQSRKKALTPQLLFSVLPWCVHESLPIDSSQELNCSSLSNKSNPAWKDEFVLSQMPMSKLLSRQKNQSQTKKTSLALFILEFRFFSLTSKKTISGKHSPTEEPDTVLSFVWY